MLREPLFKVLLVVALFIGVLVVWAITHNGGPSPSRYRPGCLQPGYVLVQPYRAEPVCMQGYPADRILDRSRQ